MISTVASRRLPSSPDELAGNPEAVRRLISEVAELPHRAVVLARALVGYVNWQAWCCPPTADDTRPRMSPSAAELGRALRCSTRTVRRAYLDLERVGLLERKARAWLPNYFRLDLEKLLTLAGKNRQLMSEEMRQKWEAWSPPPQRHQTKGEAPAGPALPKVEIPEGMQDLLDQLPAELVAQLLAALGRADAVLAGQSRPKWSADYVDAAHRGEFARLMVALRVLLYPGESDELLVRRSGSYRRRVAAAWRSTNYAPALAMLVDLALVISVKGRDWHKVLRGDRWADVRDRTWTELRARQEEADLWGRLNDAPHPLPDAPAEPDVKGPQPSQDSATCDEALSVWAVVVEAISGALDAAPGLPSLAHLATVNPERREVSRARRTRAELRHEIDGWHQLAQRTPPPLDELAASVARVEQLARELRLTPPE